MSASTSASTRARVLLAGFAAAAALAGGCTNGTRPQWLVTISTDAPVPSWGDRLLVEVLDYDGKLACDGCRFARAVDEKSFPLSFGVAPSVSDPTRQLRVRARLYRRARAGFDGLPVGTDLIDQVGILPVAEASFDPVFKVTLNLSAACFSIPSDLAAHTTCRVREVRALPEAPLTDVFPAVPGAAIGPSVLDTCPPQPPAGTACMFPLLHIQGNAETVGVESDFPPQPVHMYRYQWAFPVLVDIDEMTVGTARELVKQGKLTAGADTLRAQGDMDGAGCTFLGAANAANDALPINCISYKTAVAACAALGKHVIYERDWEAAASNVGLKTTYPWGERPPGCDDAVLSANASCVRTGPIAGGSDKDVTLGGIRNMAGNLSEWVEGILVPYSDACWAVGSTGSNDCALDLRIVGWKGPWGYRGGSWGRGAGRATTFARFASQDGAPSAQIGVRCSVEVTP